MFKKFNRWLSRTAEELADHPLEYRTTTFLANGREILFQQAGIGDIDAMVEIERRVYHGYAPWSPLAFTSELNRGRRLYLVATDDNYVVGFAGCSFNWIHNEAHITNIAVTPGYQGRGIGGALINTFKDVAIENGMLKMSLEVRIENDNAQRLYKKLGFQTTKVKRGYYEDDKGDAIEMVTPLGKEEFDD